MTEESPAVPYQEWEETLAEIVKEGGTTLLLGGTDVGKTTFARLLVNRGAAAGRKVALLDADLGQSEVGPPACVGLAFTETPVLALSDLKPHALAFVGSISPPGFLPEHIGAVCRLADLATGHLLVVDTSGYLHGSSARRLNQIEFDLLAPAHVVALQRGSELNSILAPMRRRADCRVHAPPVAAVIGSKPSSFRIQKRAMRFAAYFQNAQPRSYLFEEVALVGTWMGSGVPLAAHLLKYLQEALRSRARVYYAEMAGRHLGVMVSQAIPPHAPELGIALEQLHAKEFTLTVAPRLKHLLLGLEGSNGKLLGLGLLAGLDFRRRELSILTPIRAPGAASILRLGALRVHPDGTEAGALKPGEL